VLVLAVLTLSKLPLTKAGRAGAERQSESRRPQSRGGAIAPSALVPSCGTAKAETRPPLSTFGEKTSTIVVAGLGGGPVCQSKTSDWRANLPKFLGIYANANVIVYRQRKQDCFDCYSPSKRGPKVSVGFSSVSYKLLRRGNRHAKPSKLLHAHASQHIILNHSTCLRTRTLPLPQRGDCTDGLPIHCMGCIIIR
jgi:hypothetical protein